MSEKAMSLNDILAAREERYEKQKVLINEYKHPLVSFTLNIPGRTKDKPLYRDAFMEGVKAISLALSSWEVLHNEMVFKSSGAEAYFSVNIEGISLKRLAVQIEETHKLGRIFDIDVIDSDGSSISRAELGLPQRKCMLCSENAALCRRQGKHSTGELLQYIEVMIKSYLNC